MIILDKDKVWTEAEVAQIQNRLLGGILSCRTTEAVEAAITYARFLNKAGLTGDNVPLFIKVLEIGNHWVIDALVGDRDPFLFLSSIQPNRRIVESSFSLLAERHPGGIYPKSLSVILGVLQSNYSNSKAGYSTYALSISDLNALGKHLDEDKGQEDSLNRCILDILEKISELEGLGEDSDMEEVAIHAHLIRNNFFDSRKTLQMVIPPVLLVKMDYREFEVLPRDERPFGEEAAEVEEEIETEEEPETEGEVEVEEELEVGA